MNVNGWTSTNSNLRENIIKSLDKDIVCIAETHLAKDKTITLVNYTWFGFNRELKHKKSAVTHGGVGILVKNNLLKLYNVSVINKEVDAILAIVFHSKSSECIFIIFSCYLPPANTPWAEPTKFFGHLIAQLYEYNNAEFILIGGDFNARIGKESEVANFDHIPSRIVLDTCKNGYSEIFLDFLRDSKCCILNGRFGKDNFTSTHRGNAVVDYFVTPHDCFEKCSNFEVLLINDLLSKFELFSNIGAQSKPPDHSVLCVEVVVDNNILQETQGNVINCQNTCSNSKRYNFDNIPNAFMHKTWLNQINAVIEKLQNTQNQQCQLDSVYLEFCQNVTAEMDKHLDYKCQSKSLRKKFKSYKPFWNSELTKLWKDMCSKERAVRCVKNNSQYKKTLRSKFISARKTFDKSLRYYERQYNRNIIANIEDVSTSNPREFWQKLKNLGPRKSKIPNSVYDNNNLLCSDPNIVLNKWKSEFEKLFSNDNIVPDENYKDLLYQKCLLENLSDPDDHNELLNGSISYDEIEKVINGAKLKKACGYDGMYNEVIKSSECKHALYRLFNLCFDYGKVPSTWQKAIISPVPKSAMKDPHVPSEYRGVISALTCRQNLLTGSKQ